MSDIISFIAVLLTAGALVAGSVWSVARIQGATRELGRSLDGLRDAVERLDGQMERVSERVAGISDRVSSLEGICRSQRGCSAEIPQSAIRNPQLE